MERHDAEAWVRASRGYRQIPEGSSVRIVARTIRAMGCAKEVWAVVVRPKTA